LKNKIIERLIVFLAKNYQNYRVFLYKILSKNTFLGEPSISQPTLFMGKGEIIFNKKTNIGYFPSPFYYDGSSYIEARTKESKIIFGNNVNINNNFTIISETSITLANNILIGTNVEIYDSDFHTIDVNRFGNKQYKKAPIIIKENVWIGSNVKILKGVIIGENSVISNGSIVIKNIPPNVVAAGIPAKVVKHII
jgi:acetyltransferase-like isoleucine patch superfamily enzyme